MWRTFVNGVRNKTGHKFYCTFHDNKAKSIIDLEGTKQDKQQFSGHKTLHQVNGYDRKTATVPTLDRPLPTQKADLFGNDIRKYSERGKLTVFEGLELES